VCLWLYSTGMRAAEFCSLTWADVADIDGTWIATFVQKGGDSAEQEIPADTVRVAREAHRARYSRNPRPDDPLFASMTDTRMSKQTLWSALKRIEGRAKAAGILGREGVEFSAHLFRRTAGTHLMRRGVDPVSIQGFMRHKSFNTTAKHYVDCSPNVGPVFAAIIDVGGERSREAVA